MKGLKRWIMPMPGCSGYTTDDSRSAAWHAFVQGMCGMSMALSGAMLIPDSCK